MLRKMNRENLTEVPQDAPRFVRQKWEAFVFPGVLDRASTNCVRYRN